MGVAHELPRSTYWLTMNLPLYSPTADLNSGKLPVRVRGEEISISGAAMPHGCRARTAAQHVLVDHELAVVLSDCRSEFRKTTSPRARGRNFDKWRGYAPWVSRTNCRAARIG